MWTWPHKFFFFLFLLVLYRSPQSQSIPLSTITYQWTESDERKWERRRIRNTPRRISSLHRPETIIVAHITAVYCIQDTPYKHTLCTRIAAESEMIAEFLDEVKKKRRQRKKSAPRTRLSSRRSRALVLSLTSERGERGRSQGEEWVDRR